MDTGSELAALLETPPADDRQAGFAQQVSASFQRHRATGSANQFLSDGSSRDSELLLDSLTNREEDILHLLAKRLSNKEIAGRLGISPATVKRHAENLYSKLGVRSRREAVAVAGKLGLLAAP